MSHIISNIKIENFKSIKNQEFDFATFTPLVGYNNAGKSNILQSIKWVLRKSSLTSGSFNDPALPITMIATIEGITDDILQNIDQNHRARIEPFLSNGRILGIKNLSALHYHIVYITTIMYKFALQR